MLLGRVIFPGSSTLNQLERIFEVVGRPTEEDLQVINSPTARTLISAVEIKHQISIKKLFAGFQPSTVEILSGMITLNPKTRITAMGALKHRYISYLLVDEPDLPTRYLDETKVVLSLDDNKLYPAKTYINKIENFIDLKTLKQRRFDQKDRLILKDMERLRKIEENKRKRRKGREIGIAGEQGFEEDDEEEEENPERHENMNNLSATAGISKLVTKRLDEGSEIKESSLRKQSQMSDKDI